MTKGLFVLGMHRSGTSALSAALGMLGANLGDRLIPGREDNKKGFFEDARCVMLNVRVLRAFGTGGYGGVALPANWRSSPVVADARREARAILADLGRKPVYALKDPRLCLLADMWFDAARDLGHEVKAIVTVRHPLQVARSLEKRGRVTRYVAYLMWILYNIEAVAQSASHSRCFVSFEGLQTHTVATLAKLAAFVDDEKNFRLEPERVDQILQFLDPSMITSREDVDRHYKMIGQEVSNLYLALRAGDTKRFDQLLDKGMLNMFVVMTRSYQRHLVRMHQRHDLAGAAHDDADTPEAEAA